MSDRTILITGIRGRQGGAVARALLGQDFVLRGMTRKPDSPVARAFATRGVQIIEGDLNGADSLREALEGAWGVFAMQNTWEAGVEREEAQGKRIAKVAREVGVEHFVYTSVGSAHRQTGIPHFDNKFRVEETVRSLGFPSYAILRSVFFMENLVTPWFMNDDTVYTALNPDTALQMIAVRDVGRFGAKLFTEAERFTGGAYDVAGDSLTMSEAVRILGEAKGRTIEYVQIPMEEVRKNSEGFANMLEWLERVGYDADIDGTAEALGVTPMRFADWASRLKG